MILRYGCVDYTKIIKQQWKLSIEQSFCSLKCCRWCNQVLTKIKVLSSALMEVLPILQSEAYSEPVKNLRWSVLR